MRKKTQYIVVNEIYKTIYCGYPQKRAWKIITGSSGGIPVLSDQLNEENSVTIYSNGYVVYQAGDRATVFPLHIFLIVKAENRSLYDCSSLFILLLHGDRHTVYVHTVLREIPAMGTDYQGNHADPAQAGRCHAGGLGRQHAGYL